MHFSTSIFNITIQKLSSLTKLTMMKNFVNHFLKHLVLFSRTLRALFTNFLTLVLTRKFCNPFDDWLESTSPTNHLTDYKIRELTRELKIW